MENAHLRLGLLEYVRITEKTSTRIRLRVDRYMGEDRQAHLLSVFGNDSDVGAITAAVHEKAAFSLTFPERRDQGSLARRTCLLLQRRGDAAGPETSSASFTRGLSGTAHQRNRRKNSAAALPARGGVGHAREFSGPPSRPNMGRPHSWSCRTEEADRGDRRNRLRAGAGFSDHGGGAGVDGRGAAVRSCGLPVRDRRSRVAATVHCGVAEDNAGICLNKRDLSAMLPSSAICGNCSPGGDEL